MNGAANMRRHDYLTFKGNLRHTRYGWLRLTPAYSVHQVEALLDSHDRQAIVLDPFCGTGTTALVCAEQGIACDTLDINPFLVWLTIVKTRPYDAADINSFMAASRQVAEAIRSTNGQPIWVPPLHQIEKWWDASTLTALGHAIAKINSFENLVSPNACDLLKVAFCRTMMDHAHVSFGHQSMSFKKQPNPKVVALPGFEGNPVVATWEQAVSTIALGARSPIAIQPRVLLLDARNLETGLKADYYTCVITSPPYPNRMSYIRELRPYMYWLGFLNGGRAAGELDWRAIGGTWGCATSNLSKWQPDSDVEIPHEKFPAILQRIAAKSDILARYVHKYFIDMVQHCRGLFRLMRPGSAIHYIIGNSKFYDVILPVEMIYAAMFEAVGFESVTVQTSRKRTSKKELFEFVVSARKPFGDSQRESEPISALAQRRDNG